MHPEDRVLVAVITRPKDFDAIREWGWYRVPEKKAPRGIFAEYIAFYFTAAFGEQAYAVHYYARRMGDELVTRRELLPDEPDHPRADELYYKLQLGPLQKREPPIVSLRWRRITFIHTTWDRFEVAEEVNDLFAEGDEFVDRLYHALRDAGLSPERQYPLREASPGYISTLAVPCQRGAVAIEVGHDRPVASGGLVFAAQDMADNLAGCLARVEDEVRRRGGVRPFPY